MSGTLVPQASSGSGSAFAQQGTVDYVSLSNSTLTFSVEILSRFSKAGVEMITFAMGQAICSRFRVPTEGQKNVADAVLKLKAYPSLGNVLWFGFGIKHIVRLLCEKEQGTTCAALCACLSASYSTEYGANVLSELCKDMGSDDNLNPSLSQWYNLLDVCAGALASSSFPEMVNMFCRLGNVKVQEKGRFVKATSPEALATAIKILSDVSQGRTSTVKLRGGLDCGWIAAFARFVLCLRVKVVNENGDCIYHYGGHDNRLPQLILVFDPRQSGDLVQKPHLQLVERTLQLPFNGSFPLNSASKSREIFCPGRSSWSTIFQDTFGDIIERLISPALVYPFMVCLDTLIEHNLPAEVHLWLFTRCVSRQERSQCFFTEISKLLPELQILQKEIQDPKAYTVHEGDSSHKILEQYCTCAIHDYANSDSLRRTDSTGFCLPNVSRTIFEFACLLLGLDIDEAPRPTSTGLLTLYHDTEANPRRRIEHEQRRLTESQSLRIGHDGFSRPLTLFTGRLIAQSSSRSTAESQDGVCLYHPALEDPSYPPTEQLRRRVISGNIEFRGRFYKRVRENSDEGSDFHARSLPTLSSIAQVYRPKSLPKLAVRETIESSYLEAWVVLETPYESREESDYRRACITLDVAPEKSANPPAQIIDIGETFESLGCRVLSYPCNRLVPIVKLGDKYASKSVSHCKTSVHRFQPRLSHHSRGPLDLPQSGEWNLLISPTSMDRYTLEVLRGDFLLLYLSLSSLRVCDIRQGLSRQLVRSNGCLMCLTSDIGNSANSDESRTRQIFIHTIADTRKEVQEIELEPIPGEG